MPPLIPLPTVENAEPITSWPAPDFDPWSEGTRPRSGDVLPSGRRGWVETPAWRYLREQDELDVALHGWIAPAAPAAAAAAAAPAATAAAPAAAITEPNPSEAPQVPSAPASAYGIGTYDALKGKTKGKSKGKSEDKSKGKSKGKPEGKDRGSRSDSTHSAW